MLSAIFGIDGSGKTTAGKSLADLLSSEGTRARYAKLVDSDSLFVRYYKILLEKDERFARDGVVQNYAFVFERFRTSVADLEPLLAEHDVVILDRYVHCDIAYSNARGRPSEMYDRLLEHVPSVDLGFVLDLPVELAMNRVTLRNEPIWRFQENLELLARVREEYLAVARRFGFRVIDARLSREHIVRIMYDDVRAHPARGAQGWA